MRIEGVITVFLKNGDNYLLMKRAEDRRFYPGIWSGIGGHMNEDEMTRPEEACFRELMEETGIKAESVYNLKLRYICVSPGRLVPGNPYTVIHYIFFGETTTVDLISTNEGETYWVPETEVLNKDYTMVMLRIIEHYFAQAIDNDSIYLFNESEGSIMPVSQA